MILFMLLSRLPVAFMVGNSPTGHLIGFPGKATSLLQRQVSFIVSYFLRTRVCFRLSFVHILEDSARFL